LSIAARPRPRVSTSRSRRHTGRGTRRGVIRRIRTPSIGAVVIGLTIGRVVLIMFTSGGGTTAGSIFDIVNRTTCSSAPSRMPVASPVAQRLDDPALTSFTWGCSSDSKNWVASTDPFRSRPGRASVRSAVKPSRWTWGSSSLLWVRLWSPLDLIPSLGSRCKTLDPSEPPHVQRRSPAQQAGGRLAGLDNRSRLPHFV